MHTFYFLTLSVTVCVCCTYSIGILNARFIELYIGTVSRIEEVFFFSVCFVKMAVAKPAVLPEAFTGEESWNDWQLHFCNIADVNGWDDAAKLKWLKVRLTQRAFQKLPDAKKTSYVEAIKALEDRFEPASKKEL